MIVFEILQKTYRIIRNWWDTVARSKAIVSKTKQITQNSGKLIAEIRADGLHADDFWKLRDGGWQLRNEAENLVNEVGALGDKIKEETHHITQEVQQTATPTA